LGGLTIWQEKGSLFLPIFLKGQHFFLFRKQGFSGFASGRIDGMAGKNEIDLEILNKICGYSLYNRSMNIQSGGFKDATIRVGIF
jgi:hypothetical protein